MNGTVPINYCAGLFTGKPAIACGAMTVPAYAVLENDPILYAEIQLSRTSR